MGDDPNEFGNTRRCIMREVENSLRRLGTDWIDLYQIHRPEDDTEIDETLGALTDSSAPGRRGASAPRRFRRARSSRSGRYRKDAELPDSHRAQRIPARFDMSMPENQRTLDAADAPARLADEAGLTLIEMALAFVLTHPAVTAPIVGPRTMEQLESQLPAVEVTLTGEILDRIDELSRGLVGADPARPPLRPGHACRSARRGLPSSAPHGRPGGASLDRKCERLQG
jgi:aryl-alcohol dehydrogenase-like predicted oxidoreductase